MIGVLSLQGDVAEHVQILQSLHQDVVEVRNRDDLFTVDKLLIPGGESTVISKLLTSFSLREEIAERVKNQTLSIFGTCAGSIIVSKIIEEDTNVHPLGLLDISISRNAYGNQVHSFETDLQFGKKNFHVSFIRAPIITRVGPDVEVLIEYNSTPVLVRQGRVLASTFHSELHDETLIHELFLEL